MMPPIVEDFLEAGESEVESDKASRDVEGCCKPSVLDSLSSWKRMVFDLAGDGTVTGASRGFGWLSELSPLGLSVSDDSLLGRVAFVAPPVQ